MFATDTSQGDQSDRGPDEILPENPHGKPGPLIAVCVAVALVAAALIWYGRTLAFAWDEGYHLVAALLIAHGKQPYIDFLFPQTPLNAYWNGLLLRVIGEDWRVPHTAAALLTSGAVGMAAGYVYRRLPAPLPWRTCAAIATAVVMGFNAAVFGFGTLQAYGMCLFMIVAAYLFAVSAVDHTGVLRPALAGLTSGVAAASSLLSAPVAPILLIWILIVNRTGNTTKKFVVFCLGVLVAFIPLLRLLIKAPHQVIFGFLQYELLYRKVEWDDASTHNLGEVLSWGDSSQAVLLVLLAVAGVVYSRKRASRPSASACDEFAPLRDHSRAEVYLCGTLALVLTAYLLTARPTFTRYFLLTVPFLAIAAARGLYEVTERLSARPRPWLAAAIMCILTAYGLGAWLFDERDDMAWHDLEQTAAKVREVTLPTASLLADETVYFLLRRIPPSGMELEDSHKLTFSDAEAKTLHVVPRPKLDLMIKSGRFDTVEMCDADEIDRIGLASLYQKNANVGTCQVFWDWGSAPK